MNSGKWGAKSPDQEKITALKAQVHDLKDLKLSAQLIHKLKEDGKEQRKGDNEDSQDEDSSNKQSHYQGNEWMKIPPKDNEPKHKQVGKKTWQWCVHHMKWTMHKPENCKLGKEQGGNQDNQDDKPQPIASQATYANMLAKVAPLSMDK